MIVTISGPAGPVTVRRKDRSFGVWANRDATVIDQAPSFYAVASTGPLDEILSATENLRHRVGLRARLRDPDARGAVQRLLGERLRRGVLGDPGRRGIRRVCRPAGFARAATVFSSVSSERSPQ